MSRLAIDVHSRSPPPRRAASTHACSNPPMHTRSQACAASTAASVGSTTAADFSSIVIRVSGSASSTSARRGIGSRPRTRTFASSAAVCAVRRPVPSVVRSSATSWCTTATASALACTSSSR